MNISQIAWPLVARAVAVPFALLASAGLVMHASAGAFSGSTSNPSNAWAAGQVALTDDDGGNSPTTGVAMFNATALKPGQSGVKCLVVTSSSTVTGDVRLYTSGVATTNALSTHLDLQVEQGTGGSYSNCTGFTPTSTLYTGTLATLGTARTSWANGLAAWTMTGVPPETRTYRITYTVNAAAPNTTQNGTAQATFVWEAQS